MTATLNASASDDFIFETNGPPTVQASYHINGGMVHLHGVLWNGPTDGVGHPLPIQPSVFHQSPPFVTPVPTGFEPFQPFVPAKTADELARDAEEMTRIPDHPFAPGEVYTEWCVECPTNNIYARDAAAHVYIIPEWW